VRPPRLAESVLAVSRRGSHGTAASNVARGDHGTIARKSVPPSLVPPSTSERRHPPPASEAARETTQLLLVVRALPVLQPPVLLLHMALVRVLLDVRARRRSLSHYTQAIPATPRVKQRPTATKWREITPERGGARAATLFPRDLRWRRLQLPCVAHFAVAGYNASTRWRQPDKLRHINQAYTTPKGLLKPYITSIFLLIIS
jgi:hypothetical protein